MIFVFGSNLAGRHGKGAAKTAMETYKAEYGVGVGPTGNAYAIPTKDRNLKVLPLAKIEPYVQGFIAYADAHRELMFYVTPVGTGLSGYRHEQMGPLFKGTPKNCILPRVWKNLAMPCVLNKHTTKTALLRDAVYIGRGSPYGNPFRLSIDGTRDEVCDRFELEVLPTLDVSALRGKDLVCFCAPLRCHGDAILKKANS